MEGNIRDGSKRQPITSQQSKLMHSQKKNKIQIVKSNKNFLPLQAMGHQKTGRKIG